MALTKNNQHTQKARSIMAGKRKLGGSHTTNKAEPRGKKPSTTAGAGGDDSKKGGKKQQQQQLHNDAAERAAAKALARAAQGRVEAGEQDDGRSVDSSLVLCLCCLTLI